LLEEGSLGLYLDVGSGQQEHLQDFQGDRVEAHISHGGIRNENSEFLKVEKLKFPNEGCDVYYLFSQLH